MIRILYCVLIILITWFIFRLCYKTGHKYRVIVGARKYMLQRKNIFGCWITVDSSSNKEYIKRMFDIAVGNSDAVIMTGDSEEKPKSEKL